MSLHSDYINWDNMALSEEQELANNLWSLHSPKRDAAHSRKVIFEKLSYVAEKRIPLKPEMVMILERMSLNWTTSVSKEPLQSIEGAIEAFEGGYKFQSRTGGIEDRRKDYTLIVTPEDVKYIKEIIEKNPIPFDEGYEDWVKENPPA